MPGADTLLTRLARRQPVDEPVALVVAHPDDEVIGAGAMLPLFRRLILVHVTDGAPRNLADAQAHGFPTAAAYAAARRQELAAAMALASPPPLGGGNVAAKGSADPLGPWNGSGGRGEGCHAQEPAYAQLNAPDQGASGQLVPLTQALRTTLAHHQVTAILTHPYEGGHPDHDATAFLAAHAGLPVFEFASYHAAPAGGIRTGAFLPGPEPLTLHLTPEEQARKRAMLAAFTTQAATLTPFGTETELFRRAPTYDFTLPPHAGTLHYERYDWGMTGQRWRTLAAEAHGILC